MSLFKTSPLVVGLSLHYGMLSGMPGLCLVDASSVLPVVKMQTSANATKCPPEGQLVPS